MTLAVQLHEAVTALSQKVTLKEKRAINAALTKAGFGGKVRFRSVGEALNVADGVLTQAGLEWGQVNSASLFRGNSGHRSIVLARKNASDAFSPVEIMNTALGFQWTELENGRFEVIAYLG